MKAATFQVLIAFDQFVNALLSLVLMVLGFDIDMGWADETISSRAWRESGHSKRWEYLRRFIDLLFFFQKHHCFEAYVSERLLRHMPPELRDHTEIT